ncbi:uncharacterized protein DEA37_0009010 [Paragonimus westermani]|uniref:Uncharacterized protein n=1 Tax=Paragonimus westermani TaxID=34504 RepID=A0A5J4NNT7_9TREM|nr:uncharacterized protein DEA37_0009010 [Paragonimus westermani]
MNYEFDEAELNTSAIQELSETEDVTRWIVFEELPLVAFDLARTRQEIKGGVSRDIKECGSALLMGGRINQIHEYLLDALTLCPLYRGIPRSEPAQLVSPNVSPEHLNQLRNFRSICVILFAALRQQHASEVQGHHLDPAYSKQLCDWLLLTAGTMVRFCRFEDHSFILMQLLRLPSRLLRVFLGLLNPPDPTVAWNRSTTVLEFVKQPEVELLLTLFSVCLRPVRERERFVTVSRSLTQSNSVRSSASTIVEPPWVVVDSAGESDLEDGTPVCSKPDVHTTEVNESPPLSEIALLNEACLFVGPRDLDRILRQLNFERLIQLLAFDNTFNSQSGDSASEPGLMTVLAFADRIVDLIQACGDIYSNHVSAPSPQAHLGDWRYLAKRLACLISLLVTAVGSRVCKAWSSQASADRYAEFSHILAQYDAFCLRTANCLLLGCGLPFTHQDAVRLVCWRHLGNLFPFGLAASQSKVRLLNLIIASILPNWNPLPSSALTNFVPERVVGPLRRALLTIGLNNLGLEAIVTALGKLAAVECRPILAATDTACNYQLPSLEADLVRVIVHLIFGVTVFQQPSEDSASRSSLIASLQIVPECGRRQLVSIVCTHPQFSLPLLFDLIVSAGEYLTVNPAYVAPKRSMFLGPHQFDERLGTQELLLNLVAEAPLHIFQPQKPHIDRLITWLLEHPPDQFAHLLARTILHRLNWESVTNVETGEPFLPFNSHLDLSLALAQLVERRLLSSSRFTSVTHHPVVNQILLSTKMTASSAVGLLFANLGYQQLQLPCLNGNDTHRLSRDSSRLRLLPNTRPSGLAPRRSHSQGPPSDLAGLSSDASQSMLTWTINLLLRLHLPGCAAVVPQTPLPLTMKTDLTRIWQLLLSMNLDRNPVAAFLLISLHTRLFGPTIQLSAGAHLHRLLNTVIQSQQSILILRTLSILFHQLTGCPVVPDDQLELTSALVTALQLYQREQLQPPRSQSQFLELLIGSCVDASLYQPYKCARLIVVLLRAGTQPGWCTSKDCSMLVEACLELSLWTRHNYIPGRLGSKAYLYGWFDQEDFTVIKTLLKESYVEQLSTNPTGWSAQLASAGAAAATWAWSQSTRAIHGLKGRILGTNNDGTTSDPVKATNVAVLPEPCFAGQYVSVLNTFWSQMPLTLDSNYGPFWLLTVAHAVDWEMQGSREPLHGTNVDTGPRSQQPIGLWSLLVPVLSKHIDDLATAVHHTTMTSEQLAPEPSISAHPLDISILSLLGQILVSFESTFLLFIKDHYINPNRLIKAETFIPSYG